MTAVLLILCCVLATSVGRPSLIDEGYGYFWHITDLHWDPTYSSDSPAGSCTLKNSQARKFGQYGDYKCDSPLALVNSSILAMKELEPEPDFLIWTGDDTPHIYNDTILNQEEVYKIIRTITNKLIEVFPNKRVYSALGNHDWSPKSQLVPGNHEFYGRIADLWQPWFTNSENLTFTNGGYYNASTNSSSVSILVLNTNLYYDSNKLTENSEDPADQWAWLEGQLQNAAAEGRSVMLVAHIPPGQFEKHRNKPWFYPRFNERFMSILKTYSETINALHFGHHHTDSSRIVYDDQGNAVNYILIAPAVTPWETTLPGTIGNPGNNPAIRLVKYERGTGRTIDIDQYYLNLTAANLAMEDATWVLGYRMTDYYGLTDITPSTLNSLANSFLESNDLFIKYYTANGVWVNPNERCVGECQYIQYCAVTNIDYARYDECVKRLVDSMNSDAPPLSEYSALTFVLSFGIIMISLIEYLNQSFN